jgi:hypothetical protein
MVYNIEWLVPDDILRVTYHANFTLESVNHMVADLQAWTTSADKPVHLVVDIAAGYQFPTSINGLVPLAQRYYNLPNLGHTVLVTTSLRLWFLSKLISQTCKQSSHIATTRDIASALDYLANQSNSLNLPRELEEALAG